MEDPEMYFEKLMSVRMPLFLHDQVRGGIGLACACWVRPADALPR